MILLDDSADSMASVDGPSGSAIPSMVKNHAVECIKGQLLMSHTNRMLSNRQQPTDNNRHCP